MDNKTYKTKSGRVLNTDAVNALADEAEEGYDLSKLTPRPWKGRPALEPGYGKSPRIDVRLAPTLYKAVVSLARRDGRKVSDVTREALEEKVVKEGRE